MEVVSNVPETAAPKSAAKSKRASKNDYDDRVVIFNVRTRSQRIINSAVPVPAVAAPKPAGKKRCPKPKAAKPTHKKAAPLAVAAQVALPDDDDAELVDNAPVEPPREPRTQRMADRVKAKQGWTAFQTERDCDEVTSFGRDIPMRQAAKVCKAKNAWLAVAYKPSSMG